MQWRGAQRAYHWHHRIEIVDDFLLAVQIAGERGVTEFGEPRGALLRMFAEPERFWKHQYPGTAAGDSVIAMKLANHGEPIGLIG